MQRGASGSVVFDRMTSASLGFPTHFTTDFTTPFCANLMVYFRFRHSHGGTGRGSAHNPIFDSRVPSERYCPSVKY